MTRPEKPESACKDYTTVRAQFALLGIVLRRCHRASDGRITYEATRNGQSRVFTHLYDLHAYLAALEEAHQQATAVKLKSITFEGPFDDHESD